MKETNMEHFRGEIEGLKYSFGFINNEIESCGKCCWGCEFHPKNNESDEYTICSPYKLKWLMSEYKPESVLTEREKHFVECIEDGWLTKSKSNIITWWEKKPSRDGKHGWIVTDTSGFVYLQEIHPCAFGDMFPFITWEDEEPWAVADLRNQMAVDDQPTAYDLDKIVEQLEKIVTDEADLFATEEINYDSKGNLIIRSTTDLHSYALRCLDKAIEIVKSGGKV